MMNRLRDRLLKIMRARAVALRAFERPAGLALLALVVLLAAGRAAAQTTQFTYQGKLTDNGNPATGQYDFQFKLFDTATVGTGAQQGSTLAAPNVQVTAGLFTVQLDFGAVVFSGAPPFLEIAVKKASDPTLTTLGPRQPVAANPYAIHALNADGMSVACVSCITSSQIQSVSGSAVTGTIPVASVPAGSANYIQNGTSQQAAANFNISGNGTAGGTLTGSVVNAATQYNIGGARILSNPGTQNLFAGQNAGQSNTTGGNNAFFGYQAGNNNTTGSFNAFFGRDAGLSNTTGGSNVFVGSAAGRDNTTGFNNSFFGDGAGFRNTTGTGNSFFGVVAGSSNTTGTGNTFIGDGADFNGTNLTGNNNTLLGASAKVSSGVSNSTAIGAGASVTTSNTIVLGTTSNVVVISGLGAAGGFSLCRNSSNQISFCSSSLRYKTDVETFTGGLEIVRRLRPITFTWKDGRMRDVGFAAEEVEPVEPLLTSRNDQGEIEGVKYDRVGAVLVNAIKEQQAQIEKQQQQIAALKKLVCADRPDAEVCK